MWCFSSKCISNTLDSKSLFFYIITITMTDTIITIKAKYNFLFLKGTVKTKRRYTDKKADREVKEFIKKSYK